jgi:membrane protein implicated in regulation of membrane protease activity
VKAAIAPFVAIAVMMLGLLPDWDTKANLALLLFGVGVLILGAWAALRFFPVRPDRETRNNADTER